MNRTWMSSLKEPKKESGSARAAKQLTIRQRKFIDGKFNGKSSSAAARDAGYAPSVQRKADSIISSNPNVRQAFECILGTAGISDEMLAKRAFEGLNATIVLRETKYSKAQIVVNFTERREMLELILRVKGLLVNKHQVAAGPTLEELLEESWREPEYTDEEVEAIVEAHERRKREKRQAETTKID